MHIVPFKATYHILDSHMWIESVIVDDKNKLINSGQLLEPLLSYHDLIYVNYKKIKLKMLML